MFERYEEPKRVEDRDYEEFRCSSREDEPEKKLKGLKRRSGPEGLAP